MSSSSQDSIIVFSGNEPEGCASFIRAVIRHAFEVGKQYDRRWMASFASTCLINDASRWYTTLDPERRMDWKSFCHAMLRRYPVPETVTSENRTHTGSVTGPQKRTSISAARPTSSVHLQLPRPTRPALGTKYSNSAPKTPPPPPSAHGLIRLDFFDGSIPSRYISSQLRVGFATVYKADIDGVDDASRALALNVCFERSERSAFRVFTSDDQRNCVGIEKKSSDFSYLALVPHLTDAWVQPSPQTLQTDVWHVRPDGRMELTWHQSPPDQDPNQRVLQRNGMSVPLGIVCHLKSGSVELMRNPENYCARYPGWYEVMMIFEPFTTPPWMMPPGRELTMSPTRNSIRNSLRGGGAKLQKRRLSKRIGSGGL